MHPQSMTAIPPSPLIMSMAYPARGAPVSAATPPPAVRRPKAGVRQEKERVLMIRGVSQATQKPVAKPKPDVSRRNIQYWVQLKQCQCLYRYIIIIITIYHYCQDVNCI